AAYKVLHFATHGLSVPEIPELSALVLSQFSDKQAEDGYLRLPEIINLKLQADFVNLSACETGLGKVFRGEGVVGLTQAFLAAGANQVSVSLWQINDQSSAKLMQALYQPELQASGSYARAMNAVKRRFLAGEFGEAYRHPYYWSPFVVYGRL
ncbi:MAG: CHAT domain-containing protein, partial [Candidatus Sericytochromatia bacterium]